jgi:4-aminobutyrate aminotransferase-like enzyme/Ser/Thr protein kinase RdoA (MazF antagonist)
VSISAALAELPRPDLDLAEVAAMLRDHYGITADDILELGSQQDRNFRITYGDHRAVLKIANSSWSTESLLAQDAGMRALANLGHAVVPIPVGESTTVTLHGSEHVVRLLTFVTGTPLADWDHLAPPLVAQLGELAAHVTGNLAGLQHPGLDRWLQWDLRQARDLIKALLPRVEDMLLSNSILTLSTAACDLLDQVGPRLPVQPIHGDLTDDNLVAEPAADGRPVLTGIIDFGDLALGWRVAELAVACTSLLHHEPRQPTAVLPAIKAFHRISPLSDTEIAALWPMVVARAAVLVVSGLAQLAIDPDNAYAASGSLNEREMFDVATSVPMEVMHQAIRSDLGLPPCPTPVMSGCAVVQLSDPTVLDLSATSELLDAGRWQEPGIEQTLARGARNVAIFRHGEPRLTRTPPLSLAEPATVALGAEIICRIPLELIAPFDTAVTETADALVLHGPLADIVLRGATRLTGESVVAGAPVARVGAGDSLLVQVVTPGLLPPRFTTPALAAGWLAVTADPSALLGLGPGTATFAPGRTPAELMAQRQAVIASGQERYYDDRPPEFERGWRELMIDVGARSYVDTVNNVAMVGHGDPRIAAASARQWLLLNTNSRFHYSSIVDYSARLAALFPPELDTVFLVNSGSEAVDLALRLAKVHTGRPDVVVINEGYHGWTEASDAVSTSLHDNPRAAVNRPAWVHAALAPNTFRGLYRGAGAATAYAEDVTGLISTLVAAGQAPAAFLCEAVYGKEGAIALPEGYLTAAYGAVRAHGGLAIADEVQVGFGRLGHHLWGYEQQGVVPDIVTMAKAIGNGQPLGAVVTTRAIAESFAQEGTFFSSAGGSPVSCVVGLTVLDIWEQESLQQNALHVGSHLRDRFAGLAQTLDAGLLPAAARQGLVIGALHGMGLYQGVELVHAGQDFEPAAAETLALCDRMLDLGVIMQPTGENFNVLKVKPPLCLTRESADHFVDALTLALSTGW